MNTLLVQDEDELDRNIKKTGTVRKLEQSTEWKIMEGWISVLEVKQGEDGEKASHLGIQNGPLILMSSLKEREQEKEDKGSKMRQVKMSKC